MFDSVALPLFLTLLLLVFVVLAVYGFLQPRRFPCMASLLAKFGLQQEAEPVIVTVVEANLPAGDFVVKFSAGDLSFETRPNNDGAFRSSSWVDLERRVVYCEVLVLCNGEPCHVEQVKSTDLLQIAKRKNGPHTFVVKLPSNVGTVTVRVEEPKKETTPLLAGFSQDSRRLKAAVATQEDPGSDETEVLQKLLRGPITCFANDAKWCRMENRPKGDKPIWFWCFYAREATEASAQDALWVLPLASIVEIKATGRDAFEVTARDQSKRETLMFRVPSEVGIWVEGLKALRDNARYDENVARRKTWMAMGGDERQQAREDEVAKNV